MTDALERSWRAERTAIVSVLARRLGDLELAEDCAQDAFVVAAERWPREGVPERPGAWLTVVAWRRALDVLRHARPTTELSADLCAPASDEWGQLAVDDDRLGLILACCHPALALDVRVALTLRHVAGLTSREIAAALLVAEPALTKRLVRARRKLREGGVSFALPARDELPDRLDAARTVIGLVFTEGHHASGSGAPIRRELCDEAVWLARELLRLLPDDETTGLLAMMLLQHARADARQGTDGHLVPFAEQDRSRWDTHAIEEARTLLATTGRSRPGRFQLQAAIALVHAGDGPTPWRHLAALYRVLLEHDPSPVVALHHAMAVGRGYNAQAGLALIDVLRGEDALERNVSLHAARAELLGRSGDAAGAQTAWREAIAHCENAAQREALRRRAGTVHVLSCAQRASNG